MDIIGFATEIVETARLGALIQRHGETFLRRTFTANEIAVCSRRSQAMQHYAARWAVKQALLRSLHLQFASHMQWTQIEVRGSIKRGMRLALRGPFKKTCAELRVTQILVTAAFCRPVATGTVLVLG